MTEPFRVNSAWTPATYRKAYAMWAANASATDGSIMPRKAAPTRKPRNKKLAVQLRALMIWKHAADVSDPLATGWLRYDLHADNDNQFDGDEPVPLLLDTTFEIQPSVNKMRLEFEPSVRKKRDVEYHNGVPLGGDVDLGIQNHVPEYAVSKIGGDKAPVRDRRVVTRIRGLRFSNGEQTERVPVLREGKVVTADIRQPTGAMLWYRQGKTWRRPSEQFRSAKGELPEVEASVGIGGRNPGSLPCPDYVVDREWAAGIRQLVDSSTAELLDMAIEAANFREIGEARGKHGKHAERHGRQVVIDACEKLDRVLAANDNGYARAA